MRTWFRGFLIGAAMAIAAVVLADVLASASYAAPPAPLAAMEPRIRESGQGLPSEYDAVFNLSEVETFRQGTRHLPSEGIWVDHTVLPGDTLAIVAARFQTSEDAVATANGLDVKRRRLRSGRTLRVLTTHSPPPRERTEHIVRFGDNWRSLAARYGVEERQLRAWNPEVPRQFAAGATLTVYTDGTIPPAATTALGVVSSTDGLSLAPVPEGGESSGSPSGGRLIHGVQLPANDGLYTVRRPEFAFGSSHTVHSLQVALARFREESDYNGELIISDMSRKRGGRYAHHDSHQSGRDVDIWLPCNSECEPGKPPAAANQIDWEATWGLVKALVRTGEVQYIFLTSARQRFLYRAAQADGLDRLSLGDIMQFPRRTQTAIVRHASGHHKHMHVRFHCSADERRCR